MSPTDYIGTQADWILEVYSRNHWNGKGWFGEVEVTIEEWEDILSVCEAS